MMSIALGIQPDFALLTSSHEVLESYTPLPSFITSAADFTHVNQSVESVRLTMLVSN